MLIYKDLISDLNPFSQVLNPVQQIHFVFHP